MDYELANQLRHAGFPQGGKGKWIVSLDQIVVRAADRAYVPTLEEIIEACGRQFLSLQRVPESESRNETWVVGGTIDKNVYQQGSTPAEAVARFWLATHNKAPPNR